MNNDTLEVIDRYCKSIFDFIESGYTKLKIYKMNFHILELTDRQCKSTSDFIEPVHTTLKKANHNYRIYMIEFENIELIDDIIYMCTVNIRREYINGVSSDCIIDKKIMIDIENKILYYNADDCGDYDYLRDYFEDV